MLCFLVSKPRNCQLLYAPLEMRSAPFSRCVTQVYGQNSTVWFRVACKCNSVGLCQRKRASSCPGVLFYPLLKKLQSELCKKLHVCTGRALNGLSCRRRSLKWKLHSGMLLFPQLQKPSGSGYLGKKRET